MKKVQTGLLPAILLAFCAASSQAGMHRTGPARAPAARPLPGNYLSPLRVAVPPALPRALVPVLPEAAVPAVPAKPVPLRQSVNALRRSSAEGRLQGSLPSVYDGSGRKPKPESDAVPEEVRQEYAAFLSKLGFRDYPGQIGTNLNREGLTPLQKKVLEFNRNRYRVLNAARDLAAEVMAGLAEQGFSKDAMERGAELAARLLSLQPLDPPSSLPPEIAKADKEGITQWLVAVTVQKLGEQLPRVVSDTVRTVMEPNALARRMKALRRSPTPSARSKIFLSRVARIKGDLEILLTAMYTDGEIGQTRYAGRALAAALVRHARLQGRPEMEEMLKRKLLQRNLRLENFVGDTLILEDETHPVKPRRLKIETGDFLGERSGGREAAEITFAVRPIWRLWPRAWREKLLGNPIGLWANPGKSPKLMEGRNWLNRVRLSWRNLRLWLSGNRFLQRGYSHVGTAWVERADGVSMAWAMDSYPNAGEGGIRKIGITEQFAQNGAFLRLGVSRLDPVKVWKSFREQAREGYRETVQDSSGGSWPAAISRLDFEALRKMPRREAPLLLREINRRSLETLEAMLVRWGVGFAYGYDNELWRAYCSWAMMLSRRMGALFEIQTYRDHWQPLVLLAKKLGLAAENQDTESRIIWPGSLFIDPKVSRHVKIDYPLFVGVGRLPDPSSMPAYLEMDPALTKSLAALMPPSGENGIHPDPGMIDYAVRTHLDGRASKRRTLAGLRSGASRSLGYSAGLADLLSSEEE